MPSIRCYLLYTSGSTGKPKGIQHATARLPAAGEAHDAVGVRPARRGCVLVHRGCGLGDRPQLCRLRAARRRAPPCCCTKAAPTFPDAGRFWKNCQTHGVSIFYTAPTAIRALMKLGDELPAQIRSVAAASAGQRRRADQSGGVDLVSPRDRRRAAARSSTPGGRPRPARSSSRRCPGVTPTKPGSCTQPLPGIEADIVDDHGKRVKRADAGGYLVIRRALALDAAHHLGRQRALPGHLLGEVQQPLLRRGRQRAPRQGRLLLDHGAHR